MSLNYQSFQKAIQELENFYGGKVLNGGILESTWYEALSRISVEDLNYAVAKCFRFHPRQYNYFPSPEDIRKLAFDAQENSGAFKVQSINNLQLPPEEDQKAHKRGLIGRLYLHLKNKKRVGKGELERQDFYEKFEKYSIEELSNLLEIERPEIRRNSTLITPDHAATPEMEEYTRRLQGLIAGKTL